MYELLRSFRNAKSELLCGDGGCDDKTAAVFNVFEQLLASLVSNPSGMSDNDGAVLGKIAVIKIVGLNKIGCISAVKRCMDKTVCGSSYR